MRDGDVFRMLTVAVSPLGMQSHMKHNTHTHTEMMLSARLKINWGRVSTKGGTQQLRFDPPNLHLYNKLLNDLMALKILYITSGLQNLSFADVPFVLFV